MKQSIRLFVTFLAFSAVLLLTGCSGSGGGHSSVHYGVYSGYGYPYYGGGDNNYYYNNPNNPSRPDRPNNRPERPTTLPAQRPGGGMGRPAGMSIGGGGGMGGGGRGRR
jgi:hypothetical protein